MKIKITIDRGNLENINTEDIKEKMDYLIDEFRSCLMEKIKKTYPPNEKERK